MSKRIPDFRTCLADLIARPSVSSSDPEFDISNRPVAELLAGWFSALGFSVELLPVGGSDRKVNLLARAGSGEGGLILSGHTDTVPFSEEEWTRDPFHVTEQDGRFYGLGTADMKSFFAIVLDVLRDLDASKLRRPLTVLATCDEESTMAGARALLDSGRALGRYALIGEPTGLKPVNVHKGVMVESIRLTGQAGHASDPSLGNSALDGMVAVLDALMLWRKDLAQSRRDPRFKVATPTVNFGSIRGGDSPNRICAECELQVDVRVLPGMDIAATRAGLRRAAMQAVDGSGLAIEFDQVHDGVAPMETPADSPIVRAAEKLSGSTAGSITFATEGTYYNAMGIDTVILGPGDIGQAHQANEYLDAARIEPMRRIVADMIAHFCREEGGNAA
jgi:acetylornithine deacetylase